jgi:uncharacterized membrane protein
MVIDFASNQFTASLWGDEAFAATLAQKNLVDIVKIVSRDTSPPGYYFCLHLWMKIFGTGEVAIRALSFLFFLGTVVFIYLLAKYLWTKKTAYLAAILTITNPFLFSYAFEGRMYAILLFTTVASFYFFITQNWVFYILAATAALYSHHFSMFAIFTQFLWLVVKTIKNPKINLRYLVIYLFIFILYIPWLWPLYYQTSLVAGGFWLGKPTLNSVVNLVQSFLGLGLSTWWKNIILGLVIITLFLRRWSSFGKKLKWILIILWFCLPIALTFIISQIKSSIFYDRYLLYTIPAIPLLISSQRRKISTLLLVILIVLWSWFDWQYFFHPTKKPFRQFATYIKLTTTKQDFLINYNGKAHHLWESKYYGLVAPIYSPGGKLPFYVGTALMEPQDVIYSLPQIERIGVITSDDPAQVKINNYQSVFVQKVDSLYFLWMQKII